MKKSYSKSDLEKKAQEVFKDYPKASELFATRDGQFFTEENRADLHAGKKGKVFTFENENPVVEATDDSKKEIVIKPASAEALIENAALIETVALVEVALEVEVAGKNRTTVVAAYNARIEELKNAQ